MGNADAVARRGAWQCDGLYWQQAAHRQWKDARGWRPGPGHRVTRRSRAAAERRDPMTFITLPQTTEARRTRSSKNISASFVSSWLVFTAGLFAVTATIVHAQNPMLLRWDKAAPFPEPEAELYGVQAG